MVNKAEKMLDDVGYVDKKKVIKKPKKEKAIRTRVAKNNPFMNKNSILGGKY